MEHALRDAIPADVPVLEIIRKQAQEAAFSEAYDRRDYAERIAASADQLREVIQGPQARTLLVESDYTIMGYGILDGGNGVIEHLYTAPDYQRQGVGGLLLETLLQHARKEGHARVRARVPDCTEGFFRRREFQRRGSEECGGILYVRMVRELTRGTR